MSNTNSDLKERGRLKHLASLNLLDAPDGDAPLETILRCLAFALELPAVAIIVPGRKRLTMPSGFGWVLGDVPNSDSVYSGVLSGDGLRIFSPDTRQFAACTPLLGEQPRRFFAACPVIAGGHRIGALCLADDIERALSATELGVLEDFHSLIQRELELRQDATRDHLTGLLNRRFADEHVVRENRRAFRDRIPIAYLLIDLDHFKDFNDRYGHVAGDEALRQFSLILNNCCRRPADTVVRMGGEEFLLVLPSTDQRGAERLTERLAKTLQESDIIHEASPTQRLTFSCGGVIAHDREHLLMTLSQIVDLADGLLYQSKREGRNTCRFRTLEATTGED